MQYTILWNTIDGLKDKVLELIIITSELAKQVEDLQLKVRKLEEGSRHETVETS